MVRNISFIVIARNEEYAVFKCLSAIAAMNLIDCEVIAVDSNSSDNTIGIMLAFADKIGNLKIFRIEGEVSSAIARNVGIKHSQKKYIFFVDGDTELDVEFVNAAIGRLESDVYEAVTGKLREYQYSNDYSAITKVVEDRFNIFEEKETYYCGGNFIAKRTAVENIGLFNEEFPTLEEVEFTMRFSRKYRIGAFPITMGIHHTIPYDKRGRVKEVLLKQSGAYVGRLIRSNLSNNVKALVAFGSGRSGPFLGILWYVAALLSLLTFEASLLLVVFLLFGVDILYGVLQGKGLLWRVICHYVEPLFVIRGFLAPKRCYKHYNVVRVDS